MGVTVGMLFVVVGLWSRARWPANRTGLLLVATGYGWLAEDLVTSDIAVVFTAGALLTTASPPLLVHLILAYPSGRPETRTARAVVGLGYVVGFGLTAGIVLLSPSSPQICRCPENLLAVDNNPAVAALLWRLQQVAFLLLLIVVGLILTSRWRSATPMRRRMIAPFVGAAVLCGVVAVLQAFLRGVLGRVHPRWVLEILNEIGRVALLSLPVAFFVGLLVGEVGRGTAIKLMSVLERRPSVAELRTALAHVLGDPDLELGRWDDDIQCYVDHAGQRLPLPAPGGPRTAVEVRSGDGRVVAVVHDSALCAVPNVVAVVRSAVRFAFPDTGTRAVAADRPLPGITIREREVLALMASGLGNRAIAQRLTLSERTVESHVKNIFRKLELPAADRDNRRVRAVLAFLGSNYPKDPC